MKSDGSGCSKLVGCYTLVDPHYQAPSRLEEDESFEESKIRNNLKANKQVVFLRNPLFLSQLMIGCARKE